MKKAFKTLAASVIFTGLFALTAFAGSWQKTDSIGWWYQNDDGTWPASTWMWIDGNNDGVAECYYFNQAGYMLAGTTTPDGYQVNENGAWVANGVVQTQAVQVQQNQTQTAQVQAKVIPTTGEYEPVGLPNATPYDNYWITYDTENTDLIYLLSVWIDGEYATFVRSAADPALFVYDSYYGVSDANFGTGWVNYRTDDKVTNLYHNVTGYIKVIDDSKVNVVVNDVITGNTGRLFFNDFNGIYRLVQ